MGSSALVYVLVLWGYNPLAHEVTTHDEINFHISQSDCIQEKNWQNQHGRQETYNRKYMCLPVYDAEMAAIVRASHGNVDGRGYRSGGRIVIELN